MKDIMPLWRSLRHISLEDPITDLPHVWVMFKPCKDEVAQSTRRQMSTGPARLAQASRENKHIILRSAADDWEDCNAEQMILRQTNVDEGRVKRHVSITNRNARMK